MKRVFLNLLVLVAAAAPGCDWPGVPGSGVSRTESRQVDFFDEVKFVGEGEVRITIGEPQCLELTGDDNLLPLIRTEVVGGRLVIRPVRELRPNAELVIKITAADVKFISFEGTGVAGVEGVDNDSLGLVMSGAGFISAGGRTDRLDLVVTGSCSARLDDLQARQVKVKVTGAGSAEVNAAEQLNVAITGAGAVVYAGNPQVTQSIVGAGSVMRGQ